MNDRIAAILARWHLTGTGTSVRVYDLDSGTRLYSRNALRLQTPASNMKLVTSATALARLGAGYRFRTELYLPSAAPDAKGVLHGNVVLKGYGDPTLSTPSYARAVFHRPAANIGRFVTDLKKKGVTKIVGRVLGDASYFDGRHTVSTWATGDWQYCGPLSALACNEGSIDGHRAADPALAAAIILNRRLEDAGITVTGVPGTGAIPANWVLGATVRSPRLPTVLAEMNKPSDNFFAEEILKGLGAAFRGKGSTNSGVQVARTFLIKSGIPVSQFRLYDGSGLSPADKLTAAGVTRLLTVMAGRSDATAYWASLSIAGRDGTLAERMRGTAAQGNLHGKTGTLTGASALSGYVTSKSKDHLVFSILMNGRYLSIATAHVAQDAIAVALARSSE